MLIRESASHQEAETHATAICDRAISSNGAEPADATAHWRWPTYDPSVFAKLGHGGRTWRKPNLVRMAESFGSGAGERGARVPAS